MVKIKFIFVFHSLTQDLFNNSFQIDLSLMAFKSGGIFGKGPGQGDLKERIPDANTDFIFAVAGEELGFIFCFLIIFLISLLIIRFLLQLLKYNDPYIIISKYTIFSKKYLRMGVPLMMELLNIPCLFLQRVLR